MSRSYACIIKNKCVWQVASVTFDLLLLLVLGSYLIVLFSFLVIVTRVSSFFKALKCAYAFYGAKKCLSWTEIWEMLGMLNLCLYNVTGP